ncbi:hypothetical protein [Altererythrobacter sp. Root672]|uniref:hypothetical protein n=1 Tax=Altererythrobacter sp. Root672 TaxID=1736584 RepID=UPI0006FFE593|nr:hypothetical protein [Altererythrobacter sp. Root672]KRA80458.1 hypothetical protein ASD76_14915 [Altererythrobacter sp. Root672]
MKSIVGIFVKSSAAEQLGLGLWLLVFGLVFGPFIAAKLVQTVDWMNTATGLKGPWHDSAMAVARRFFAVTLAFFAANGAVLVAVFAAVKSGLISDPWVG